MDSKVLKELKKDIKRIINDADEEIVLAVHSLLKYTEIDWWDTLSKKEKKSIKAGLKDIKEGRTIPHEEVMKKYEKYFSHNKK